jgi:molybdopterin-binding protein
MSVAASCRWQTWDGQAEHQVKARYRDGLSHRPAGNGAGMKLSARNQIPATVSDVTRGEATANVALDAGGIRLVASITVEAADELKLEPGSEVVAIVKASDVIVAIRD